MRGVMLQPLVGFGHCFVKLGLVALRFHAELFGSFVSKLVAVTAAVVNDTARVFGDESARQTLIAAQHRALAVHAQPIHSGQRK